MSLLVLIGHRNFFVCGKYSIFYPFLPLGELIIRQAPNVLKFDTFSGQKRGITGSLTCTNFKISFVSANKPTVKTTGLDQRNALYKDNDIPLTFVRSIFQVTGKSKKQLTRNSSTAVSSSSKILEIRTKNFKVFTFSFKFTPEHDMKSMMIVLVLMILMVTGGDDGTGHNGDDDDAVDNDGGGDADGIGGDGTSHNGDDDDAVDDDGGGDDADDHPDNSSPCLPKQHQSVVCLCLPTTL
ncbi:putative myotubularin-related protein 10-A isoform X4 [Apostichopus japonicus]|uniref:Putative myotubularin-related protein 10-A isoform X4 n=1 Tax=Stichopus japonicus TaxID=307972 RepID=A0A2G8L5H0_STIJA|nr:putative myotubularin-related protein 10-A isoform X4 [Apostichopus japonicus]